MRYSIIAAAILILPLGILFRSSSDQSQANPVPLGERLLQYNRAIEIIESEADLEN